MSGGPEEVDLGSIEETIASGSKCIPCNGMEFDTEEEAYLFYKNYGEKVGFSIKKQYCHKSKIDGVLNNRKFVCSKEGQKTLDKRDKNIRKRRPETRTLCLAQMQIVLSRNSGKYVVTNWNDDHNHPLHCVACNHMTRSQQRMSAIKSTNVDVAENPGISIALDLDGDNDVEEVPKEKEGGKQASSSRISSFQSRQHLKRNRTTYTEDEPLAKILDKLGEVAVALGKLMEDRLVVSNLYNEVMKTEGFDEESLASAFDHLVQNEMLAKAFLVKNNRLRKLWIENFQKQMQSVFVGAHVKW